MPRSLRKAVPWAIVDSMSTGLLGILTLSILTRVLNAEDFGAIALAQSIVILIQLLTSFGLTEAIIQRQGINALYINSAFWLSTLMGILGFLISLSIACYFLLGTSELLLAALMVTEGFSCLFVGVNLVPAALLDRDLETKVVAKRTFAGKMTYGIVAITLAIMHFGIWSIVIAGISQNVISTAVLWSYTEKKPGRGYSIRHAMELCKYGMPIMLENALWAFLTRVFNLLVGAFHGLEVLGIINIATRTGEVIANVISSVSNRIGLPLFSSIQDQPNKLKQSFKVATEMVSLVAMPIFVGLLLTSSDWVPLFIGKKWGDLVPLINVVCIVWMVSFTRVFASPYLRAIGFSKAMLLPALCGAAITIIAVYVTQHLSPIFVMTAWGVRVLATFPLSIFVLQKHGSFNWKEQLSPLIKPFIATASMSIAVLAFRFETSALQLNGILNLFTSILVGAVVYSGIVFLHYRNSVKAWRDAAPA
ncbi:MAG: oligosaccharide flippase family protein [Methylotenera sp.]|nr:oligosaccharide flippase family protein [Methylotenera sp.]